MTSDGTPWRPLVHVADIAQAMALAVEAPRERVHGEIFFDAEMFAFRAFTRLQQLKHLLATRQLDGDLFRPAEAAAPDPVRQ